MNPNPDTHITAPTWLSTDSPAHQHPNKDEALTRAASNRAALEQLKVSATLIEVSERYPWYALGIATQEQCLRDLDPTGKEAFLELIKLESLSLNTHEGDALSPEQAESMRRLLLSVIRDVRIVLVKLADQISQLLLAKTKSREIQIALAQETHVLYAPLANKLGIWQLKWQLEDLSFRFLHPDDFQQLKTYLKERRQEREDYIHLVVSTLENLMQQEDIKADIKGRPKHIFSIWKKMQRKQMGFEHVMDTRAVRIHVDTVKDCYAALGAVHATWRYLPDEFDDYIANPKQNNYQSLHTAILGPENKVVEVQIRTHAMHEHAELGVAAHWQYKEGGKQSDQLLDRINWLRGVLDSDNEPSANDLRDQFENDLFADRIFAVTPVGDVMDLPAGATALDFAYLVHTNLGHRCRGAKINGKMVPLTQTLSTGDSVEVITTKSGEPSRDWLVPQYGYLNTPRARSKVRAWFRKQGNEYNQEQGHRLLERELERMKMSVHATDDTARALGFQMLSELYVAVGNGDLQATDVVKAIQTQIQPKKPSLPKKTKSTTQHKPKAVQIDGVGQLDVVFAQCCQPSAPNPIQGYVSVGRGVTVHHTDCTDLARMVKDAPERLIDVGWANQDTQHISVSLLIIAIPRHSLLNEVTQQVMQLQCAMLGINTTEANKTDDGYLHIQLGVGVSGLEALSRLIHNISQLNGVKKVARNEH